ncbi:MAG TPA: hypothetical protein VK745_30015 [Polyangiaceae bacterium]|nr:hypothetical protein [Polyangiaceae bacterium]
MNQSFLVILSLLGTALLPACGSSGGSSLSSICTPPSTKVSSPACTACIQSACSSEYAELCSASCDTNSASAACTKATGDVAGCVSQSCSAQCVTGQGTGGTGAGGSTSSSGGTNAGSGGAASAAGGTSNGGGSSTAGAGAGGAASTAGGTSNGGSSSTAGAGASGAGGGTAPTQRAYCYQMVDGTCTVAAAPAGYKSAFDKACVDGGGTAPDSCPTANLVGCCTTSPSAEVCSYSDVDSSGLNQSECAMANGTWSTTP